MDVRKYLGHESQLRGAEEVRLVGGRGDGMRLLQVRNGRGLDLTISLDRCADIARLHFRGVNMGYFSPTGYVAPACYDRCGDGFLRSFSAGFLSTCGLQNVGPEAKDDGKVYPMHGTIGNAPAEYFTWEETGEGILIHAIMRDAAMFQNKLELHRTIRCSYEENTFSIRDQIVNLGDTDCPAMLMYHINLGYPLLSEDLQLYIPSDSVRMRGSGDEVPEEVWKTVRPPRAETEEACFFHSFSREGLAAVYNAKIGQGLAVRFAPRTLPCFNQWNFFNEIDYVLGLEPGTVLPVGRKKLREMGHVPVLPSGGTLTLEVGFEMLTEENWKALRM